MNHWLLVRQIHSIEKELLGDGDADANFSLPATGVKASTLVAKVARFYEFDVLQMDKAVTATNTKLEILAHTII